MLTPYSPLDFVEAIVKERHSKRRLDDTGPGLFRRIATRMVSVIRPGGTRRPRAVPKPA